MRTLEHTLNVVPSSDVQATVQSPGFAGFLRRPLVLLALLLTSAAALGFPFAWQGWVQAQYSPAIFSATDVPQERVALVLGARVYGNGRLSGMLHDRVETAVALYHAGKVQKLLMSGDNSSLEYNEPEAMMAHAIALGVPAEDVQPDYAGRRTYDSCYRARAIFQVESLVIVTQAFHLPQRPFLVQPIGDSVGRCGG